MVARLTGGQEAAGSSPVIPRKRLCKGNFAKPFLANSISFIHTAFKSAFGFKLRRHIFLFDIGKMSRIFMGNYYRR